MSTIQKLKVRAQERLATDRATVDAAARALAAGREVSDVGALESALAGAGIGVEDFDSLVALCRERAAARKVLAGRPAAEAASRKAARAIEKASTELAAAIDAAQTDIARLEAQRAAADAEVAAADAARERLLRGAPGLAGERLRDAVKAEVAALEAAEATRRAIREARERASLHAWRAADDDQHRGDIEEHQRRTSRAEREASEGESALPGLEAAVEAAKAARLRAEADAIEA